MNNSYQSVVPIPTGYFLETDAGFLSVYIPEERTNLMRNPTLAKDYKTGQVKGTKVITFTQRIKDGPFGLDYPRFTGNTIGNFALVLPIVVTNSTVKGPLTFSIWARSPGSNIQFQARVVGKDNVSNANLSYPSGVINLTNDFAQYSFTFTSPNGIYGIEVEVYVTSGQQIDIAGIQLEQGSYATSFIHGYNGEGYSWNGQPFNASSTRSADVICGGRKINLRDLGFRITNVEGLGIPDNFDINRQPKAFGLGSIFTCRSIDDREITIEGVIYSCSLKDLLNTRNKLGYALFDKNKMRCFEWQPRDCLNTEECVQFTGLLDSGMTFGFNSHHGEELEISLINTEIALKACEPTCTDVTTTQTTYTNRVISFNENGVFTNIPQIKLNGSESGIITQSMTYSSYTKHLYATISYTFGGGATQYFIVEFDGLEWFPIISSNSIFNTIYCYGNALCAGSTGNPTISGVNGNGWTGTSAGPLIFGWLDSKKIVNMNALSFIHSSGFPNVTSFVSDGGDYIFFGGKFAANGGFEANLGMLNIKASGSPGREPHGISGYATGSGGILCLLYVQEKGELWMGGDFSNGSLLNPTVAQCIMGYSFPRATQVNKLTGGASQFYQYPQNLTGTGGFLSIGTVYALEYYKGRVMIGGDFDDWYMSSVNYPGYYRCGSFAYVDDDGAIRPVTDGWGFRGDGMPGGPIVLDMTVCDGILHITGKFSHYCIVNKQFGTQTGLVSALGAADYVAVSYGESGAMTKAPGSYKRSAASYGELSGVNCTDSIDYSLVYFINAFQGAGSFSYPEAQLVTICNNHLEVYPRLYVRGPGTIRKVQNLTNNSATYVDYVFSVTDNANGVLSTEEILEFDFSQNPTKLTSSSFGDLSSKILPASSPIYLNPGENQIMIHFDSGSPNANTTAWMCWQNSALSAEAIQGDCL